MMLVPSNLGLQIVSLQPYHNFCHVAVMEEVRFRYLRHLPNLLRKIKRCDYHKGYNDSMHLTIIMFYETDATHQSILQISHDKKWRK